MFLGVPGTIRAPRYTFYVYMAYMDYMLGTTNKGTTGIISAAISQIGHQKKA